MDPVWQFAAYVVPAIIVFLVSFLILKAFLNKEYRLKLIEYRQANMREALPVRLQAYERLTLFLERISLNNLLPRVRKGDMNVAEFRMALVNNIAIEYEHNLSQQVYVSAEAWSIIKAAKEEVISIVNRNAMELPPQIPSIELSKKIINELAEQAEETGVQKGLLQLKNEVLELYNS